MDNIICIAGPTASGKTALAVELAKLLNGEVVSCDSMQIYRRMDIGTAKPTQKEMQGIPHHMLDVIEPWEDFSVSRYCELANPIVEDILSRGKTVIIAGGTGLYMDALIRGNAFAPFPETGRRQALEAQAQEIGMEAMLELLRQVDPASAAKLHPADKKRIIRALEVYEETGEPITVHNLRTQAIPPRYHPLWLGIDYPERAMLYRRIDLRVEQMLEAGLLAEIAQLLEQGVLRTCTAMQAIGYKEFLAAMDGRCTMEEAIAQVQQASRRYAKRQLTWFRRNPAIYWLHRKSEDTVEQLLADARRFLTN